MVNLKTYFFIALHFAAIFCVAPTASSAQAGDPPDNEEAGKKEKIGILITNIGTPDKPNKEALKTYLKEFLSDPRVIEIPKLIWQAILRLIILNLRPQKSAKLYKSIWKKEGGPLLLMLQKQKKGIQKNLKKSSKNLEIEIGMRYGNPSIKLGLEKLRSKSCRKILILPLFR